MREKAELEKELVEEKAKYSDDVPSRRQHDDAVEHDGEVRERTVIRNTAFEEHLSMIRDGPPCQYCQDLMGMLVDEPSDRRRQGVEEVADLKQLMLQNPTKEEMQEKMRDFKVLPELTLEM